jgi:hypothetical protein
MPQLSFDKTTELHRIKIDLLQDERNDRTIVSVHGLNRADEMLASTGVSLSGFAEVELLPDMLAQVAYGWLYGGSRDAVTQPAARLRERRKALHALGL